MRHFEAMGTKTAQVLFDGLYSHHLKPDIHYIPVKRDESNMDEVIEKMNDTTFCNNMVETAYKFCIEKHTYKMRCQQVEEITKELI